jgi:hypothetical protein
MMFGTWGSGENQHVGKGHLEITDNLECPICAEVKDTQDVIILYVLVVSNDVIMEMKILKGNQHSHIQILKMNITMIRKI